MRGTKLRFAALFVFIICLLTVFVSCAPVDAVIGFFADDGTGHIFKFALDSDPKCLDPQLAEDKNSISVAKNLFAGLVGYDENGKIVCRIASDYVISSDGLTYTFYLKEGYSWHAVGDFEAPVVADDFVFGFQRLMDPKTASSHSEKYFCIFGARQARLGETEPDSIGVKALDDLTLEFTLEYPEADFLYLLAELPAAPCCREFFETSGGKYGLEAEATCSNGPFYLRYWLHDPYGKENHVRLRRNPGYSEVSYVSPAGINYLITEDYSVRRKDFTDGSTDAMLFSCGQKPEAASNRVLGYASTVGLVFNEDNAVFSSAEVRGLFSLAVDRDALDSSAGDTLKRASSAVPDDKRITSRGYSFRASGDVGVSNLQLAEYKWSFTLSESEKSDLIGSTVMVPSDFEYSDALSGLTDSWYKAFGIHFNIDIVNPSDYQRRIKEGDYDIALAMLDSSSAAPIDYLSPFGSEKRFGFSVSEVVSAEQLFGSGATAASLNHACSEAENVILSEFHFIPIWQAPTVLCVDDDAEGILLDPFSGAVYFENAKMF